VKWCPGKIAAAMKPETRRPPQRGAEPQAPEGAPRRSSHITVLEDVNAISEHGDDLQDTLQRIVEVIARRTGTDVCSIYLLEPRIQRLTLRATTGLSRTAAATAGASESAPAPAVSGTSPACRLDGAAAAGSQSPAGVNERRITPLCPPQLLAPAGPAANTASTASRAARPAPRRAAPV